MSFLSFIRNTKRNINRIKRFQRQMQSFAPKPQRQMGRYASGHPKPQRKNWSHLKETMYREQAGLCNGCRAPFPIRRMQIDHYVPLAAGGGDDAGNLQLLCKDCNREKWKHPYSNQQLFDMAWRR